MSRRETAMKFFDEQKEQTLERTKRDIEKYRKGDIRLSVHTSEGASIPFHAEIKQKTHEFKFGANIFMLDELETPQKNKIYKDKFAELFNLATLPFYWKDIEPERGHLRYSKDSEKIYRRPAPELCLEYCKERDIEPKLHCLNYMQIMPDWVPDDIDETLKLLEGRFKSISESFASRIPNIEVINETLCDCGRKLFYYTDVVEWSFDAAEKYFKDNELTINEASHIWYNYKANRMPYYMQIERALAKGARIDSIGMQFHQFYRREDEVHNAPAMLNPNNIFKILDLYGDFKKPTQITEVTVPAYSNDPEDEEIQADILEWLYRIWFSHENMDKIIYWNLVDGYAAWAKQGDMTSGENYYYGGLLRFDMSEKPAYKRLKSLIYNEWNSSFSLDASEDINARVFYGDYDITVRANGKTVTKTVSVKKDADNTFDIEL